MPQNKTFLLLALSIFFIYACGGSVENSDTTTIEDTTPPIFDGGDPDGAVIEACSVTAAFNEPIELSSITDQSFTITDDATSTQLLAPDDGTWQLDPSSDTIALFVPKITIDGQYSISVTTAITDIAGNHLAENHYWTFTTSVPCPPSN